VALRPKPPPWPALVARRVFLGPDRGTWALGAAALGTTGAVIAGEIARVWRRGAAPLPADTDNVLGAAELAARQTVDVAVEGYREVSARENALLNLQLAFAGTFVGIRATTYVLRRRRTFGPLRDLTVADRHIHHFVPGIAMAFLAGGAAVVSTTDELHPLLAIPFGAGVALTLDESALLLELDDVYWTERGLVSVQVTLASIAILGGLTMALRLLRRGEREVLEIGDGRPSAEAR
jgi:hypothetical protein